MKRKGQSMQQLKTFAIGLVVVGVTLTVGLKVTSSVKSEMVLDKSVDNETFNATTNPDTITVSVASESDFKELDSVTCYDSTSQSTELSCNVTDASKGEFNVSGTVDTDKESVDYLYTDKATTARQGADDAIAGLNEISGFLPIIGLVVAAAVVIGLVSSGFGSSSGRRGKA